MTTVKTTWFQKFVDDTLKEKGKFSQARVMAAVAFPIAMLIGIYIVISDRLLGLKTVNSFAIQVFTAILGFVILIVVNSTIKSKFELTHAENIKTGQRNLAKNVFAYTTNGEFLCEFNSIPDTSESLNLNINAVRNALYREIRYKNYMFFRELKTFDKYIANKSFERKIFVFNEEFQIIDQSISMIQLAEKYQMNYNCLNSRCNRFSNIDGLYFVKETKMEEFKKLKNISQ